MKSKWLRRSTFLKVCSMGMKDGEKNIDDLHKNKQQSEKIWVVRGKKRFCAKCFWRKVTCYGRFQVVRMKKKCLQCSSSWFLLCGGSCLVMRFLIRLKRLNYIKWKYYRFRKKSSNGAIIINSKRSKVKRYRLFQYSDIFMTFKSHNWVQSFFFFFLLL